MLTNETLINRLLNHCRNLVAVSDAGAVAAAGGERALAAECGTIARSAALCPTSAEHLDGEIEPDELDLAAREIVELAFERLGAALAVAQIQGWQDADADAGA